VHGKGHQGQRRNAIRITASVTGGHGLGARRVQAVLPDLPEATAVVLDDYARI